MAVMLSHGVCQSVTAMKKTKIIITKQPCVLISFDPISDSCAVAVDVGTLVFDNASFSVG